MRMFQRGKYIIEELGIIDIHTSYMIPGISLSLTSPSDGYDIVIFRIIDMVNHISYLITNWEGRFKSTAEIPWYPC